VRAVRCINSTATVVEVPSPTGDGVRVKVASAGICGSDIHLLAWNLPATFGHEFAGTLPDGRSVAVEPITPCRVCEACVSGAFNLCALGPAMVLGVGLDGGMADECIVPESALIALPSGVTLGDACLIEPIAVAVHGVRRGAVRGGQRVGIIGGGTIGQTALVAAQAAGARADLAARHDRQREAAARLGAGELTDGYDVVIEAAGTTTALADAIDRCQPGGTVVLLGTYWEPGSEFPGQMLSMKEITLVPSSMYGRVGPSRDIEVAASLLAARPEIGAALITHRFPLDAAGEAFAVAQDRAAGAIKVVLEP
jgi:threonine dehydrogenase-like Zn-dependent dehydrogenase